MGDPLVLPALPPGFLSVDPRTGEPTADDARARAFLLSVAPMASDEQAQFFADFTDATRLGGHLKLKRIGLGALVGLVVGGAVAYALKG